MWDKRFGIKCQLFYFLGMWLWASHISLKFSIMIFEMKTCLSRKVADRTSNNVYKAPKGLLGPHYVITLMERLVLLFKYGQLKYQGCSHNSPSCVLCQLKI